MAGGGAGPLIRAGEGVIEERAFARARVSVFLLDGAHGDPGVPGGRHFGMQSNAQPNGLGPPKIGCAGAHFHWA